MEGNLRGGREDGVHRRVLAWRAADDGTVRAFWDQPRHGLPAAEALSGGRRRGVEGALAGPASAWLGDGQRSGRGARGAAPPAALLGTEKAARGAAAPRAQATLAGVVDHRRPAAARGAERAPAAARRRAGDPAVSADPRAERSVVHRF